MSFEREANLEVPGDPEEKQLCVNCVFPNDPMLHFCVKCGAPMSSYASTGPFESLFAEGHVYRQAVEKPRSFVVVLGIWILFTFTGLAGVLLLMTRKHGDIVYPAIGAFILPVSVAIIWKTTRSYLKKPAAVYEGDVQNVV